jgi:ketosteroid isomerase-like protein
MKRTDRITEYYRRIDAQDVDAVLSLFADDAVYWRADRVYRGKPQIDRFFREERLIRGHHAVDAVWQVPGRVIATGRFQGTGEKGDPRSIGFIDIWTFGAGKAVTERRTFLATGHLLVER